MIREFPFTNGFPLGPNIMRSWMVAVIIGLATGGLLLPAADAAGQLYTCGMHPQIIKNEPGNCPICRMKLTPVRANSARPSTGASSGERTVKYYKSTMIPGEVKQGPGKDSMGMDMIPVYDGDETSGESNIHIEAATIQRMNLKTALVEHGPVQHEFRTVGTVVYNEEGLRDITTKYEGWIEKLHVNTTWAVVKAGDPLFEIYSPDLYNAQLNLAVALKTEGEAGGSLTRAALSRLRLFDVPEEVIERVKRSGDVQRTLVFRAPADGVVIAKMAIVGQMIKPGEQIYRLASLSTVWVQAQIYEKDFPFVREGQAVEVHTSYGPERTFEGTVQLLLPEVEEQTRTASARIVLPNPDGFLRPGMFVKVSLAAQLADDAVLVPDIAVLRSGERNTVFVALDGGFFEPREVKLGARSSGNFYQVLSGLEAGERIVTSGQFMLDSESQLREAIQKMLRNTSASGAAPDQSARAAKSGPMARAPATAMPDRVVVLLRPIAVASADAAAALAADDLAGYQRQLPLLRSALTAYFAGYAHATHSPLGKYQNGLPGAADLGTARQAFEPFSTAIADLARENNLHQSSGLHIFECPMAPETGKARWLQRAGGTKNPFFGSEMLGCGDEIAAPGKPHATTAAPPMVVARLLRDHLGRDPVTPAIDESAQETCGNCGMTNAEMAAGTECAQAAHAHCA